MVIHHDNAKPVAFTLEIDKKGDGSWKELKKFRVKSSLIHVFDESDRGAWVRLRVSEEVKQATVHFHYRDKDERGNQNSPVFNGLASLEKEALAKGVIRSNRKVLSMLADGEYYELNDRLELTQGDQTLARLVAEGAQPKPAFAWTQHPQSWRKMEWLTVFPSTQATKT